METIKNGGGESRPLPTIQEVLDIFSGGDLIAETAVIHGEVINLEEDNGVKTDGN